MVSPKKFFNVLNFAYFLTYLFNRFMEQLNRDVRFLCRLGIIDYSLLIGIKSLRRPSTQQNPFRVFENPSELLPQAATETARNNSATSRLSNQNFDERPLTSQSIAEFVSSVKRYRLNKTKKYTPKLNAKFSVK